MKTRKFYLLLLIIVAFSTFTLTSNATPSIELLIISPQQFVEEITPLKLFKDSTGRPTEIVTLEDIYLTYTGFDEAEQVKRCIADYEETYGVKYVLLLGDIDRLPIRYFVVKTVETNGDIGWFAYYFTDHYYADLYYSGGARTFCTWDADGDGYYAETERNAPSMSFQNVDEVDYVFDVIVGRVPASSEDEVTVYVDKVIKYELETYPYQSWQKKIILVSGNASSIYPSAIDYSVEDPPYSDLVILDDLADRLSSAGYSAIKLYHYGGDDAVSYVNINKYLNLGAGLFTIFSHQNQNSFGVYKFTNDMAGLYNSKLPVFFSLGCSSAQIGPIGPNQNYLDTQGNLQNYGYTYPVSISSWTTPIPPNVLQSNVTDQGAIPEYLLVSHDNKGGIAYIGSTAESAYVTEPMAKIYHQSIANGETVLGEVWRDVGESIINDYDVSSNWEYCRRWLFMNVFGDPSLEIGGLPDKPPMTSIQIGSPKHVVGDITYVRGNGMTDFSIIHDSSDILETLYQIYPHSNPHKIWQSGQTFSIGSSVDGVYTVGYYGRDVSGNTDYPKETIDVILDNTPPETSLTLNGPIYQGDAIYINSETSLSIESIDTGSGIDETFYAIKYGTQPFTYQTYTTPFSLTGSEGNYQILYYSFDNVINTEPTNQINLVLDNTGPIISINVGTPQLFKQNELYITSDTPIIISVIDSGVGLDKLEYTLTNTITGVKEGPYTYNGPINLPENSNNNLITWTIEVIATDLLNNQCTDSISVSVDNKPPSSNRIVNPASLQNGKIYISPESLCWFEPMDYEDFGGGIGVDYTRYRLEGTSWITYMEEELSFPPEEKIYYIAYQSVDLLWNMEEAIMEEFHMDTTPPQTSLIIGEPKHIESGTSKIRARTWISSDTPLSVQAEDTLSGISTTWKRLDESGYFTEISGEFYITDTSGTHIIEYLSMDNVNNVEETKHTVLMLDNTSPSIQSISVSNGDYVRGEIDFRVEAIDSESGISEIKYSLDGRNWYEILYNDRLAAWTCKVDTTKYPDGSYSLKTSATDHVKNTEIIDAKISIDNTGPEIAIASIKKIDSSQVVIEFNIVDNGLGVESARCSFDGEKWYQVNQGSKPDVWVITLENKAYADESTLIVSAIDLVGNEGLLKSLPSDREQKPRLFGGYLSDLGVASSYSKILVIIVLIGASAFLVFKPSKS